jgi:hypothetical protein
MVGHGYEARWIRPQTRIELMTRFSGWGFLTQSMGFRHYVPVPDMTINFYQTWQIGGIVSLHGHLSLTKYCCSDEVYRGAVFALCGDSIYLSDGINSLWAAEGWCKRPGPALRFGIKDLFWVSRRGKLSLTRSSWMPFHPDTQDNSCHQTCVLQSSSHSAADWDIVIRHAQTHHGCHTLGSKHISTRRVQSSGKRSTS